MSQIFSGNLLGISKEVSKIGERMELWEGVRVTRSHNVNTITKICCWCHKHIDGSVHVNLFNNRYFWVHGSCDVDNYSAVCFTPTFDTISEFADYIKNTICNNQTIDRREWSEIATVLSNHSQFVGITNIKKAFLQIPKDEPMYLQVKNKITAFINLNKQVETEKTRDIALTVFVLRDTILPRDVIKKIIGMIHYT
jgi:hypothetical protein